MYGKGPARSAPIASAELSEPMGTPLLRTRARPVHAPSVARVATKGTSRAQFIRAALTRPTPMPIPAQMAVPVISTSVSLSWPLIMPRIANAAMTPASPQTAPTDRSMPPEMITKVSPTASKISVAKFVSRTAISGVVMNTESRTVK